MQTLGQLSRLEHERTGEPENSEGPLSQAERQRRMVVYTLNATLLAGLLLAFTYLGGRIMEMRAGAATVPSQSAIAKPPAQAPAALKPAALGNTAKPATTTAALQPTAPPLKRYAGVMIQPKPGEIYLQIGAYGPTFTHSFVEELTGKGYRPVVAQGPADDLYRVMIGPFPDAEARRAAESELESHGITGTMARKY